MIPEYQIEELYERCIELGGIKYALEDKIQDILDFLVHSHITLEEMEKATPKIIKEIQTILYVLGYDCWPIDGVAGDNTKNAIKRFKKDHGVEHLLVDTDGYISNEFLRVLRTSVVEYDGDPDYSQMLQVLEKDEQGDGIDWVMEPLTSSNASRSEIAQAM